MTIVYHDDWEISEKGKKDVERHQKKVEKAIKDSVKDVISEENIITKRDGKKVKIPIKGMKDYKFIYGGPGSGGGGAGQGEGKPGDIIHQKEGNKGKDDGKPGKEKGEYYLETEVDIDYIIKIMFQDLGLPWIEEKTKKEKAIPKGWKFETITKTGIMPMVHKKRTMIEAIKRNVAFAYEIMRETGCSEEDANKALIQSVGGINEAINIINSGNLDNTIEDGIFINEDDLRFKQVEQDVEYHSNAVVIAMMDVSGSMTTDKKYLARSMLFWMVEFLKKVYDNVEICFIRHTTEAEITDEEKFFNESTYGGTYCYSAFEKANWVIDNKYPVNEWNVYCVYVSDGEDFDTNKTLKEIDKMIQRKVNMVGYTQINTGDVNPYSTLLKDIITSKRWNFKEIKQDGTYFFKDERNHFLASLIKNKNHVYPTLKHFLFERKK